MTGLRASHKAGDPFKMQFCNGLKTIVFAFAIFAATRVLSDDYPFKWNAEKSEDKISVKVEIPDNNYLYSESTKVQVESSDGLKLKAAAVPNPENYVDELQQENNIYKAGEHKWIFDVSGRPPYKVKLKYQGCSKSPFLCYPPREKEIELEGGMIQNALNSAVDNSKRLVEIKLPPSEKTKDLAKEDSIIGKVSSRGGWWIFIAAFIGGLLSTLTPCVLPLIPITVGILSGKDSGKESSLLKALAYVAGIVIMFTALAALAAFSGRVFGAQILGNPISIVIFASIFLALSLSMLGLYDIQLPSSLQTKLNSVGTGGVLGPFLMGLVAGIIAVPCTGPVLGALLGIAAASANPFFSILLLFSYAVGFGLPFLFIASGAKVLPKGGAFMDGIKSLLGIVIMTISIYAFGIASSQFENFLSSSMTYARIISILCIVTGFILGAVHADGHSPNVAVKFAKIAGALLVSLGIVWNLKSVPIDDAEKSLWLEYSDSSFQRAAEEKNYILLDFGAKWCAACKEMDETTLKDQKVLDELSSKWIAIKIDCTLNSPELEKMQKKYDVRGLPGFVVLSPGGKMKGGFSGYHNTEDFLEKIKSLRNSSN